MVTVIKDKDLVWDTELYDVVLLGTNPYCKLDNGLQSKLRYKYPIVEKINDIMPYADRRRIGTRKTITETTPIISLCYVCGYPDKRKVYLDYDGLENCLATANMEFKGKKVATTIMGASRFDGNGDKTRCEEIIRNTLTDVDLFLYDYEQLSKNEEIRIQKAAITAKKHTMPLDEYYALKAQQDLILHKLYLEPDPNNPRLDVKKQLEQRGLEKIYKA